jgi:arylsulfatase A-like enzyme
MKLLRRLIPLVVVLLCAFSAPALAQPRTGTKLTNVVMFLVDDLGWADLGCFGSTFYETPHIDRLAASGMKFTQAYTAASICSPTRASILTGRHPVRVDITDWIPGAVHRPGGNYKFLPIEDRSNLALEEVTLAEMLKGHGYQTWFLGKWHLGDRGHWPTDQGFDVNIGGNDKGSPPGGYYAPWTNPTLQARQDGEYLTERLTEESVRLLENRDPSKPFFLCLWDYNVHTPIEAYQKRVEHYRQKAARLYQDPTPTLTEHDALSRARQDNADYASMVAAVDDSVGAILDKLDVLGLTDNTLVIFFSDNGGLCTLPRLAPTSNLPLRSGKGWLYEGGIRVPLIIRAPGVTRPGSVSEAPVVSMDFVPSILELAGLPAKPTLHADGHSLVSQLRGRRPAGARTLYWHYPHYHGSNWKPGAAIRDGDWKLIEFYHDGKVELYNLATDLGEKNDLSAKNVRQVRELRDKLARWQKQMSAKMPVRDPAYQPSAAAGQAAATRKAKKKL